MRTLSPPGHALRAMKQNFKRGIFWVNRIEDLSLRLQASKATIIKETSQPKIGADPAEKGPLICIKTNWQKRENSHSAAIVLFAFQKKFFVGFQINFCSKQFAIVQKISTSEQVVETCFDEIIVAV